MLEWSASGRHRKLRAYIDRPGGIALDDCTRMSPVLSNALDAAEVDPETPELGALLQAPYVLEVSSPGLDRPLRRRSHFSQFVGRRATVRTVAPVDPDATQRTFHGRIEHAQPDPDHPGDEHRGTLVLRSDEGHLHIVPLTLIRRANLVYEG
jgi:ribosome maturation factor RimP